MNARVFSSAGRLVAAAAGAGDRGPDDGATLEKGESRVMTGKVVSVEAGSRMIVGMRRWARAS